MINYCINQIGLSHRENNHSKHVFIINHHIWLVVEPPLWKNMSQLGWWTSQLNGKKQKKMFQSPPSRYGLSWGLCNHHWLVVWTPLKNISQLGWWFPIHGKIKNVPNHQPPTSHVILLKSGPRWPGGLHSTGSSRYSHPTHLSGTGNHWTVSQRCGIYIAFIWVYGMWHGIHFWCNHEIWWNMQV